VTVVNSPTGRRRGTTLAGLTALVLALTGGCTPDAPAPDPSPSPRPPATASDGGEVRVAESGFYHRRLAGETNSVGHGVVIENTSKTDAAVRVDLEIHMYDAEDEPLTYPPRIDIRPLGSAYVEPGERVAVAGELISYDPELRDRPAARMTVLVTRVTWRPWDEVRTAAENRRVTVSDVTARAAEEDKVAVTFTLDVGPDVAGDEAQSYTIYRDPADRILGGAASLPFRLTKGHQPVNLTLVNPPEAADLSRTEVYLSRR
jgi:hypothetical protein